MKEIKSFKMPFQSGLFNKNQRVWIIYTTGDLAAYCYGRYRGKYRYIRGWVNWDSPKKEAPIFKAFKVRNKFFDKIMKVKT